MATATLTITVIKTIIDYVYMYSCISKVYKIYAML